MRNLSFGLFLLIVTTMYPLHANAIMYTYDISGTIDHSDLGTSDPFVAIGESTFQIYGSWDETSSLNYCTIAGITTGFEGAGPAFTFSKLSELGRDEIYYRNQFDFSDFTTSFHISGWDSSESLITSDGHIDNSLLDLLDWQIYWIGITPSSLGLPEYWEWSGKIKSVDFGSAPVPEPATLLLLSVGLAGAVAMKRKHIKRDLP